MTRLLALAIALAAACGAHVKPPDPLEQPDEIEPPDPPKPLPPAVVIVPMISKPRPALALDITLPEPDPTHDLRWPLSGTDHPELSPRYDVAKELAEPGLDWIGLCKIGAHRRHPGRRLVDQVQYLKAWCAVLQRDIDGALALLAPLRSSVVYGLAQAVRADVPNIIAEVNDVERGRKLLATNGLIDLDILDRLAATYIEIGKDVAAFQTNELAIANDNMVNLAKHCQRLKRRIVMNREAYIIPMLDKTRLFEMVPPNKDATCDELELELDCWLRPGTRCDAYYAFHKITVETRNLIRAYQDWPNASDDPDLWWQVVRRAENAMPLPAAYEFAIAAMEGSLATTRCDDKYRVSRVKLTAERIRMDSTTPTEHVKWLEALETQADACLTRK